MRNCTYNSANEERDREPKRNLLAWLNVCFKLNKTNTKNDSTPCRRWITINCKTSTNSIENDEFWSYCECLQIHINFLWPILIYKRTSNWSLQTEVYNYFSFHLFRDSSFSLSAIKIFSIRFLLHVDRS